MSALRRVLGAPWLWVAIAGLKLALALVFARPVRAAISASLGPFALNSGPESLIVEFTLLVARHEAVGAVIAVSVLLAAALGLLLWLLVAGAVFTRLARSCSPGESFGAALRHLPGLTLVAVYTLLPRGLVILNLFYDPLGISNFWARALVFWIGWTWCTLALDRARAGVVLRGRSAVDPRPLLGAFVEVLQQPRRSLGAAAVLLVNGLLVIGTLLLGIWFLGAPWLLWAARGLAALGVGLVLWRSAFAVEAALADRPPGD